MDLGYSSSDTSNPPSDSEHHLKSNKRTNEETIDVSDIFNITTSTKRQKHEVVDVSKIMSNILDEVVIEEEEVSEDEFLHKKTDDKEDKLPNDADIKEFNLSEFYNENIKLKDSGELDANKQENIGKLNLHKGAGGVGSLKDVINFNIKNEDKIVFQNNERIAREHDNKKKKM